MQKQFILKQNWFIWKQKQFNIMHSWCMVHGKAVYFKAKAVYFVLIHTRDKDVCTSSTMVLSALFLIDWMNLIFMLNCCCGSPCCLDLLGLSDPTDQSDHCRFNGGAFVVGGLVVGSTLLLQYLTVCRILCVPTGTIQIILSWGFLHTSTAGSFSVTLRRILCRKAGWNWTIGWQDIPISVEKRHPVAANPSTVHWITHLTPCTSTQELTRSHCSLHWLDFGWCV